VIAWSFGTRGSAISAIRGLPLFLLEKRMRRIVVLAVLAVIVLIIAVQFGPSLVSH
jgi:hypothetical protein